MKIKSGIVKAVEAVKGAEEKGTGAPHPGPLPRGEGEAIGSASGKVAPMVRAELRDLEVAVLEASKTNPRKVFSKEGLDELAASIREHGIVQPLIVRILTEGNEGGKRGVDKGPHAGRAPGEARYEVVAGERRLRAAHLAGLKAAPCLIREMSGRGCAGGAVYREFAAGRFDGAGGGGRVQTFDRCEAVHGGESLAVKLGMSRGHVFNRLRLARSSEAGEEGGGGWDASVAGEFGVSVANAGVAGGGAA
jgi:ParB family chromosome partitioning protein